MLKRITSICIFIIFICTLLPTTFLQRAYAYTSNSYFNNLRVGLTSMSATSISITLNGDYALNGQTYLSGSTLNLWINGTSISLNGTSQSEINLIPNNQSNLLTITAGSVSNKYMGSFLMKVYNGKILPINIIDMENYLKGVVGYEMSDYFPVEALKAQAVAARNYALSKMGYEAAKGYDFDDTIYYQVYKGYNASYTRVIAAVEQTKGQVLLYNDKLVETLYSAWHGGVSENSENVWGNTVPYLRSVQDTYESDPWPNGNRVLTNTQIQSTLMTKGYLTATDTFVKLDLSSITNFASGRVSNINVIYKNALGLLLTKSITKDSTRTFLSLPSNLYTVTYDSVNGTYTFSGKGNGHGLGMSQIGAKNRANAGQTYDEILRFYFQNTYSQNLILKAGLSSLAQSANSLFVGEAVSVNSTAAGGNGYGYLFKYIIKSGSNTVLTREYSSNSALDFVPTNAGSYTIEAYVKDKFSIFEYDDKKESSFIVYESPILKSFTLSKTELLVGQTVSANVDVQSGSGAYLYKYEVTKDNIILESRDFSSGKEMIFTPTQSGNYAVTTYVKDFMSTKSYDFKQSQNFNAFDPVTIASFVKEKENIIQGDIVDFSTIVAGGSNKGTTYKFQVIKDGEVIYIRDFEENSKFSFVANSVGNYQVNVFVKDNLSLEAYDDTKFINFTVLTNGKISYFQANKAEYLTGDIINLSAAAEAGSGSYLYKYVISKDGMILSSTNYSSEGTLEYIASTAGTYSVTVYLKDVISNNEFEEEKTLSINVYNPELATITAEGSFYEGKAVTLNASSTGSSSVGFSYKYEIYINTTLVAARDFNSSSTFSFTAALPGTYTLKVYGKDGVSSKDYDSIKQFSVTINTKPLYLSTLPLKYGMSGSDVVALQNALVKLGYTISDSTGKFGNQTKKQVIAFQKSKGLTQDGIVGSATYKALNEALIERAGIKTLTY